MAYTLNTNSPDFIQNDGSNIAVDSTNYDSGTLRKGGNIGQLSNRFRQQRIDDYETRSVGIITQSAIGIMTRYAQNIGADVAVNIQAATGQYAGWTEVISVGATAGRVGDSINVVINDRRILSNGRIIAVTVPQFNYIVSLRWPGHNPGPYPGTSRFSGFTDTRPFGNRQYNLSHPGEYNIRKVSSRLFGPLSITTNDNLSSGASDFGQRKKVHEHFGSGFVDNTTTRIRQNRWNPYIGDWDQNGSPHVIANTPYVFNTDDETIEHNPSNKEIGGEFAYRYGITVQEQHGA